MRQLSFRVSIHASP